MRRDWPGCKITALDVAEAAKPGRAAANLSDVNLPKPMPESTECGRKPPDAAEAGMPGRELTPRGDGLSEEQRR